MKREEKIIAKEKEHKPTIPEKSSVARLLAEPLYLHNISKDPMHPERKVSICDSGFFKSKPNPLIFFYELLLNISWCIIGVYLPYLFMQMNDARQNQNPSRRK